jgi:sigma-E factor negative regulatory protein RseC
MTRREITVGQCVLLGLRESALLKLAFATYVFPLLTMLAAAMLVASFVSRSNSAVLAGAVLGLAAGFAAIRWIGKRWRASPAMQPVLLD